MRDRPTVAALSDVGCKRQNNEDSFGYDEATGIYVLSDGMGGSAAGEVASQLAVKEVVESYSRMFTDGEALPAQDLLYHAVCAANATVHRMSTTHPEMAGMGATLVAVCLVGRNAIVANIGDSRAYLLRNGVCSQITQDHSLAAEQVRLGLLTAEAAAAPGVNTAITRAIGMAQSVEPDLFAAELLSGDKVLLATDGLMRHVSDPEIAALVDEGGDVATGCRLLIDITRERGARDNVTCLLIEVA